jgi:hypothetical protein
VAAPGLSGLRRGPMEIGGESSNKYSEKNKENKIQMKSYGARTMKGSSLLTELQVRNI